MKGNIICPVFGKYVDHRILNFTLTPNKYIALVPIEEGLHVSRGL